MSSCSTLHNSVALVVEEYSVATRLLSKYMRDESFHPRQVSDVRMRPVVGRIRYGHYSFIFLRVLSSAKSLAHGDRQKIFTEFGEWMFLAVNASIPAVMFGMRN